VTVQDEKKTPFPSRRRKKKREEDAPLSNDAGKEGGFEGLVRKSNVPFVYSRPTGGGKKEKEKTTVPGVPQGGEGGEKKKKKTRFTGKEYMNLIAKRKEKRLYRLRFDEKRGGELLVSIPQGGGSKFPLALKKKKM